MCASATPTASTPARGETKLDLVNYYLSVGDGIVNACGSGRACCTASPRGSRARRCTRSGCRRVRPLAGDGAGDVPAVQPDCGRAVRHRARTRHLGRADVDRRVPPVEQPPGRHREARRVAHRPRPDARVPARPGARGGPVAHEVLDELGATGWPKTSGGKGMHIYVRIEPEHGFKDVRRAALAFAREVERRAPDDVTTTWWRRDRDPPRCSSTTTRTPATTRSPARTSVRGNPQGTVSTPIRWDEIDEPSPGTSPSRRSRSGMPRRRPARRHRRRGVLDRAAAGVGRAGRARGRRRPGRKTTATRAEARL